MEGSGLRPPLVVDLSSDSDDDGDKSGTSRQTALLPSSSYLDLWSQLAQATAVLAPTIARLTETPGGTHKSEKLLNTGISGPGGASGKKINHAKYSPGAESDDDDCCILEEDPDKVNSKAESKEDSDEELVVTRATGPVACRDFPHARHSCATFPFDKTLHKDHCLQCHCYVCDVLVPQCASWGSGSGRDDHCNASDKDMRWKVQRRSKKLGGPPPVAPLPPGLSRPVASNPPQRPTISLHHLVNAATGPAALLPPGLPPGLPPVIPRNTSAAVLANAGAPLPATWLPSPQYQAPPSTTLNVAMPDQVTDARPSGASLSAPGPQIIREAPVWTAPRNPLQQGGALPHPPAVVGQIPNRAPTQAHRGVVTSSTSTPTTTHLPVPPITGTKRRRRYVAIHSASKPNNSSRNELLEARLAEAAEEALVNGVSNHMATTPSGAPINFSHFPSMHSAQQRARAQRDREATAAAAAAAATAGPQAPSPSSNSQQQQQQLRMPDESVLRAFLELPSLGSLAAGTTGMGPASSPNLGAAPNVTFGGPVAAGPVQVQPGMWQDLGHLDWSAPLHLQTPRYHHTHGLPGSSVPAVGTPLRAPGVTGGMTKMAAAVASPLMFGTGVVAPSAENARQSTATSGQQQPSHQSRSMGNGSSAGNAATWQATIRGTGPASGASSALTSQPATDQQQQQQPGHLASNLNKQPAAKGNQQLLANQQLLVRLREQQQLATRQQQGQQQPGAFGVGSGSVASGRLPPAQVQQNVSSAPQPQSASPSHLNSSAARASEGAGVAAGRPGLAGQGALRPSSGGTGAGSSQRGLRLISPAPAGAQFKGTATSVLARGSPNHSQNSPQLGSAQGGETATTTTNGINVGNVTANGGLQKLHAGRYPVGGGSVGHVAGGDFMNISATGMAVGIPQVNHHPNRSILSPGNTATIPSHSQCTQPVQFRTSYVSSQPPAPAPTMGHPVATPTVSTSPIQSYPSMSPAWPGVPCMYTMPSASMNVSFSSPQAQLRSSSVGAGARLSSSPMSGGPMPGSHQQQTPMTANHHQNTQQQSPMTANHHQNTQQQSPMTANYHQKNQQQSAMDVEHHQHSPMNTIQQLKSPMNGNVQPNSSAETGGSDWPFAKETSAPPWSSAFLPPDPSELMLEPQDQNSPDHGLGSISLWPTDLMDSAASLSPFALASPTTRPRIGADMAGTFPPGHEGGGGGNVDWDMPSPTQPPNSDDNRFATPQAAWMPPGDNENLSCHAANGGGGGLHEAERGEGADGSSLWGGGGTSMGDVGSGPLGATSLSDTGEVRYSDNNWPSGGTCTWSEVGVDPSCPPESRDARNGSRDGGGRDCVGRDLGFDGAGPSSSQVQQQFGVSLMEGAGSGLGSRSGVGVGGSGSGQAMGVDGTPATSMAAELTGEVNGGANLERGSQHPGRLEGLEADLEVILRGTIEGSSVGGGVDGEGRERVGNGCLDDVRAHDAGDEIRDIGVGLSGLDGLQPAAFSGSQAFDYSGEVAWPCWV